MTTPSPHLFPWFGGKALASPLVWELLGQPANLVIPFFGAGAELWACPALPSIVTVNDLDPYVSCVWRAMQTDPAGVARWADFPAFESDLHARHVYLRAQRPMLRAKMEGDPDYYDVKLAGWWLWGISLWIGSGWCGKGGAGPWEVVEGEDGSRQLLHLGHAGQGVKRQLLHLGDAGQGVTRQLLHLGDAGRGVTRQLLHLGNAGRGGDTPLEAWFRMFQTRLHRTRVCCGDWLRVCGDSVTIKHGLTAVLLDPPYSEEEDRDMSLYAEESRDVAHAVRAWCLAHGHESRLRIILYGYGEIHDALLAHGWTKHAWQAHGGLGNQGTGRGRANKYRERLWASPACLTQRQGRLW
jgi:DNA adenine methylase